MNDDSVTVYWRPGCGFCRSLFRQLEDSGLAFERVNIHEDPTAAAFVRSVANGNETVPTVRVGDVALVNPTGPDVLATVAEERPDVLPADDEPPRPGRVEQAILRVLGG